MAIPSPRQRAGPSPVGAAVLLFAFATFLHVAYAGVLPLSPQEAYYWQYARHLALSYFDHPPAAAWTIWAFTSLLGDSERVVRLAATFWSAVFFAFFLLTARRLFGASVALLASAAMLVTPFFSLGQTIITPDAPLIAAWVAALYFTVRALQEERGAWLIAAGFAVGVACLGKYTGLLLGPQILLALLLDRRGRRMLRTAWPYVALATAALLFLPVIVWNARNGWPSFVFQFVDRGKALKFEPILLARFFGLQALIVSPVLLLVLLAATVGSVRRSSDPAMRLCALFSAPLLLLLTALSPFHWVKMNWAAPAYPSALLAAAAFYTHGRPRWRWLLLSTVAVATFATIYVELMPLVPAIPFPARDATTEGWKELAARVARERVERPGMPVVGCYYRVPSTLAYYLPDKPETFSSNVFGDPGLAYGYWGNPAELAGREVLVIVDDRDSEWCRSKDEFCRPLEPLEPLEVRRGSAVVTTFRLWRCRYLGPPR